MMKKLEGYQVQIDAVVRNSRDAVPPNTAGSRSDTSTQDRGLEEYNALSKTTGARGVKGQDSEDGDCERSNETTEKDVEAEARTSPQETLARTLVRITKSQSRSRSL
jgi:hypothetical protein